MLHIISTSTGLEVLFGRLAKGDVVIFVENAVLCLHKSSQFAEKLLQWCQSQQCYVLEADIVARGLAPDDILSEVIPANYQRFVMLTVENKVIKTWG